ncbi:hypothetical protein HK098_003489 [Nowakowskiella sp. JEL0407]|nr:hypothetical protein HK098_003489 [Nowakowskiella sp. JEL0407]
MSNHIPKPEILTLHPTDFITLLQQNGISTLHFVRNEDGSLVASHPILQQIADYFKEESTDYDSHEGFFLHVSPKTKVLQSAFVHRTKRGPGAGGVRSWFYDTMEEFFRDGLRLSKGMSHKNALADLWWGGGKGVMARNTGKGLMPEDSPEDRETVYKEYGAFLTSLRGCYCSAEDVGTSVSDVAAMYSMTRYTTCIPAELGGSGNPSIPTARGVVRGLQAAFEYAGKSLYGAKIAVQGVGHVGTPLIEMLFELGVSKIIASDVDSHREEEILETFAGKNFDLRIVQKGDMSILFEDVDAVCPCATGSILNSKTIPQIKAQIVCGAANNQLTDIKNDDKELKKRGIIYIPDFLVNRMGIVNCADEHMGALENDPKLEKHLGSEWENSIYRLTLQVLLDAEKIDKTTQEIALDLAEKKTQEVNPLYGHRGKVIIQTLLKSKEWQKKIKGDNQNSSSNCDFVLPNPQVHPRKSTIQHWQLRDLIACTSKNEFINVHANEVSSYNTETKLATPLLKDLNFQPTSIAADCGFLAAGGQRSQLIVRQLNSSWYAQTAVGGSINNAMTISKHRNSIRLLICNNDQTIKVYSLDGPGLQSITSIQLPTAVNYASVSPDGKYMVAVGDTNMVYLYDVSDSGDYCKIKSLTGLFEKFIL